MKYIVQGKFGGTVLVILGFGAWFGASAAIPESWEWHEVASYGIAGFAFFLAGCFLPEYRDKGRFVDRRSALRVMTFFLWLAVSATLRLEAGIGPIVGYPTLFFSPFACYFLATYLIRGFRAAPDYATAAEALPSEEGEGKRATPLPKLDQS